MKKYLTKPTCGRLALTAVLCCAMTTMVLTSCSDNWYMPFRGRATLCFKPITQQL